MKQIEIEIKFFLAHVNAVRDQIHALGAESRGRVFETNIRYEDALNSLMKNRTLLRLRKDSKVTLTFKSEMPDKDHDFKIHRELEVEINDFQTMNNIIQSIGFHQEQVYEKWRETYTLGGTVICLDTMPFGDFIEIEGKKEQIRAVADKIGLIWEERIRSNYLALFETVKEGLDLSFSDITFQNFKSVTFNPADFFAQAR